MPQLLNKNNRTVLLINGVHHLDTIFRISLILKIFLKYSSQAVQIKSYFYKHFSKLICAGSFQKSHQSLNTNCHFCCIIEIHFYQAYFRQKLTALKNNF